MGSVGRCYYLRSVWKPIRIMVVKMMGLKSYLTQNNIRIIEISSLISKCPQ